MSFRKVSYFFLFCLLIVASCKESTKSGDNKNDVLAGFKEIDLSDRGMNLVIQVPTDATIEQSLSGALEIRSGNTFQITIAEGSGNMELYKSDIVTNDVSKLKRFLVEEKDALFYESEITKSEYHFIVSKKKDNTIYEIQDIKAEVFNEDNCRKMFEAAKSAKIK
jgi:hypothetical protein